MSEQQPGRTGSEHLAWCKRVALEHLDRGETPEAVMSMVENLELHPETRFAPDSQTFALLSQAAILHVGNGDIRALRDWVVGFR